MKLRMAMITIDCADPRGPAEFWTAALGTAVAQDFGGEFLILAPHEGGLPLALQRVPEPRANKNRVHIDFGAEDREQEVKRLVALGAAEQAQHEVAGFAWTVLSDPEGNEFCVSGSRHG